MSPEETVNAITLKSASMTRPVYRGQADSDWLLESGAIRRLKREYGEDFPSNESKLLRLVHEYHQNELIMPMQVIDGKQIDELPRLSVLQHQGAATGLLDFTEYPLIALWFACEECKRDDKDAKIFILDIGNPQVARNSRRLKDNPFGAGQMPMYYEPEHSLGARIIAQRSVFVIRNPLISDQHLKSVVVPKESKGPLRDYLARLGLSQTTLFSDISGLAKANTTNTPLQTKALTPEQYRDRGNRAYQEERYDDALAAYTSYVEADPNVAEPHLLMGNTLAERGQFEDADQAYTKAIEINHRAIDPQLYYNRGNVRAATGNYSGAVEDFTFALQYGYGYKRVILKNRGNSKFAMHKFEEAYQDFKDANLEQAGSDTALAMGNCKVRLGKFEDAHKQYSIGIAAEPESTTAMHCQKNAEQVRRIREALDGHDFQVRQKGGIVHIETAHMQGQVHSFPIAGNQGNTGNISSGGGKGYEGMDGFAVVIRPTTS